MHSIVGWINRHRSPQHAPERWIWLALILGIAMLVFAYALAGLTRPLTFAIAPGEMEQPVGHSYAVALRGHTQWPWALVGDMLDRPPRFDLRLSEDGHALGPSNIPHPVIRERGEGRFSHWNRLLLFSTSDNSDPRTNGRVYSVVATERIQRSIVGIIAGIGSALFLTATLTLAAHRRRQLLNTLHRGGAHLWSRRWDYVWAAAFPTAVSALTWLVLPPVWNNSDSVLWMLFQWEQFPQHAILYPAFMSAAFSLFGDSPRVLSFATAVQHLVTIAAILYLASAYREWWKIVLLSVLSSLAVGLGLYAQGLLTEALNLPFLLVTVGAVLRLRRDGMTLPVGLALFIGLLGGIATRHASVIFVVIPIGYAMLAALLSERRRLPSEWMPAAATLVIALGAAVTGHGLAQSTCYLLDRQCTSLVGRTGVYRIRDTYELVPSAQRALWLKTLGQAAPDQAVRRTLTIMAQTPTPWLGTTKAIAADPSLYQYDPDLLMNAGYSVFARSLDPYILEQWRRTLLSAVFGPAGGPCCQHGQFGSLLRGSTGSILEVADNHEAHVLRALQGTGAERRDSAAQYLELADRPLTRMLDLLLPLDVAARTVLLVASGLLAIAAVRTQRRSDFTALLTSLWLGFAAYALALTFATVVLPRYLAPLDLLIWVGNAIAMVALIEWALARHGATPR